jgi:hypothetical protein
MNPSDVSPRRRRTVALNPEFLETRQLLTGGAGNTFAIMQATVQNPNQRVAVPFTLSQNLVTTPHNQIVLGLDIAKGTNSTIQPRIVALQDLTTKKMIPLTRTHYTAAVAKANPTQGSQTTAVQARIRVNPNDAGHKYAVIVSGNKRSTGGVLVGFYLPGDTAGGGVVSSSDLTTTKSLNGTPASSANYNFAADANRDGVINSTDFRLTQQNFGVNVLVSPVISANLDPATDSAFPSRTTSFRNVIFTGQATPGASITFAEAAKKSTPVRAVADVSGKYSINVGLGDGSNTFNVTSTDSFGQSINGAIAPVVYDATAKGSIGANGLPIASTAKPTTPTS